MILILATNETFFSMSFVNNQWHLTMEAGTQHCTEIANLHSRQQITPFNTILYIDIFCTCLLRLRRTALTEHTNKTMSS